MTSLHSYPARTSLLANVACFATDGVRVDVRDGRRMSARHTTLDGSIATLTVD